jgi:hypothetical protein
MREKVRRLATAIRSLSIIWLIGWTLYVVFDPVQLGPSLGSNWPTGCLSQPVTPKRNLATTNVLLKGLFGGGGLP